MHTTVDVSGFISMLFINLNNPNGSTITYFNSTKLGKHKESMFCFSFMIDHVPCFEWPTWKSNLEQTLLQMVYISSLHLKAKKHEKN